MKYLYGEEQRLLPWAQERIHHIRFRPDAKAIGVEMEGAIKAVTVYDTFSDNDCLVHLASDQSRRWVTREFCKRTMAYPFVQCELRRITCLISVDNRESLNFTMHFGGWVKEGILRKAGRNGEHLVLFGMLREECRWLPLPMAAEGV